MDKKITKNDIRKFWFYLYLILPFFGIPFLNNKFLIISKLYNLFTIINGVIIFLLVLHNKKYSKIINYILGYFVILLISTLISKGDISNTLLGIYQNIMLCLLVDYGINKDKVLFLNALEFVLSSLVILNFLSILFFPNGMYINMSGYDENWFLGYKNSHILYIIPLLLISFLKDYNSKRKLGAKSYLYIILSISSTVLSKNSTGLFGLFIIILFLVLKKFLINIKWFNIKNYFLLYIFLFFFIIVFRLQNLFSFLIVDVLQRNLTFTGRTYIWDAVLEKIKQNKFLGYGNMTFKYNNYIYSTHNSILEITYKTGYIGLLFYFLILIKTIKEISFLPQSNIKYVISIMLFSLFMMMLTEGYTLIYYLYIFVIVFNAKIFFDREVRD